MSMLVILTVIYVSENIQNDHNKSDILTDICISQNVRSIIKLEFLKYSLQIISDIYCCCSKWRRKLYYIHFKNFSRYCFKIVLCS